MVNCRWTRSTLNVVEKATIGVAQHYVMLAYNRVVSLRGLGPTYMFGIIPTLRTIDAANAVKNDSCKVSSSKRS